MSCDCNLTLVGQILNVILNLFLPLVGRYFVNCFPLFGGKTFCLNEQSNFRRLTFGFLNNFYVKKTAVVSVFRCSLKA